MCFSATASFVTAGLLTFIGLQTVTRSINDSRRWMLGIAPLFFALQQSFEGVLWLALEEKISPYFIHPATIGFIFFAWIVWPVWIPLLVYAYESVAARKKILVYFVVLGLSVATYLGYKLLAQKTGAFVKDHHIFYSALVTSLDYSMALLYCVVTIIPFFIATDIRLKFFGFFLALSCFLSYLFWYSTVGSVWCFFAALLSGMIFVVIK